MTEISTLLAKAAIPAFNCPTGTKLHILHLGIMQADEGWYETAASPIKFH